jgi:glycerate 2-kinase
VQRTQTRLRRDALSIFRAALEAADAANAVRAHFTIERGQLRARAARIPLKDVDRIFLVAAGKAAVEMAAAAGKVLGPALCGGLVVTKYGHAGRGVRGLEVVETGHPIPDQAGVDASKKIESLLRDLNARDLLVFAVSGGASALLSAPLTPITLPAKQKTTDLLLRAGADIFDLNAVRKHLSFLKGGRMAALAYPATVVSLLLSDVIGDPFDVIGSGPTVPDTSTFENAIEILKKFSLLQRVPKTVSQTLLRGARGELSETPKPGDPLFRNVHNMLVGSNRLALDAAAKKAKSLGYRPLVLSGVVQGEAREVARVHAAVLREVIQTGRPLPSPACLLSGGETTVSVRGRGKGGRNQELALAGALDLAGVENAVILAAGTDGTDGPTDAAGAIATGDTLRRAAALGLNAREHLQHNNSYPFFDALGDLVKTGPTGTNVMDVNVMLAG